MKNTVRLLLEMIKENKIDSDNGIKLLQSIKNEKSYYSSDKDMAVIGISLKMPDADSKEEFWNNILFGKCSIGDLSEERKEDMLEYLKFMGQANEVKVSRGAYLNSINEFDYTFFNISPKEASLISPSQRLFLQTAWNTIIDAGYEGERIISSRTGVFLGYSADELIDYKKIILDTQPESLSEAMIGNTSSIIASRIAYLLDLKGPAITVDTACSSSLVAIHLACNSIRNNECDMAIAGGINLNLLRIDDQLDVGIQSKLGKVRTFDDQADGTLIGEGVAAVLIKPLKQAIDDNDNIYAVIKGSAINQDGKSVGLTAPNAESQENVIVAAWKDAGIDPSTISYIEAHGTGTKLGDPVEITGIERAFRRYTNATQFCGIGSLKTNIGHLDQSAGIAGFIKAVLSLKNKQLPPSLNFDRPNRKIDFINSPVYVVDKLQYWNSENSVRRCSVSSFGISGTNCHIVLEEAPERKELIINNKPYLFMLSAKSEVVLKELIIKYWIALRCYKGNNISNIIYTVNTGRKHWKYRIAIIATSKKDLILKLEQIMLGRQQEHNSDIFGIYNHTKNIYNKECKNDLELAKYLALSYVLGEEIDWTKWYKEKETYIKENMVEYPFQRSKCWIRIQDSSIGYGKKLSEPLVDRYLGSVLDQRIFVKNINLDNEWVLNEHKIKGNYVLVGTAYIEMLLETLKYYTNYECIEISKIIFRTPFIMEDLECKQIQIIIYKKLESYSFTIVSKLSNEEDDNCIKHVEGKFKILNKEEQNYNINEIINRCKSRYIKPNLLNIGKQSYMEFGPRWSNITDMYIGQNESISLIKANPIVKNELECFILHPALLDNALATENIEEKSVFLPFLYESITINGKLPDIFYSHVKITDKERNETIKFNIDIMDLQGNSLVKIRNYVQKKVQKNFNINVQRFLNCIHWKESKINLKQEKGFSNKKVLIISDEEEYSNKLVSQINLNNRVIIYHKFSDISYEEIKSNDIHHIMYISGNERKDNKNFNSSDLYNKVIGLFTFVKNLMELKIRKRLEFYIITMNAYSVLGDIEVYPINTAILGFGKVISQEYNNIICHCIDTNESVSAECIVEEIYGNYSEREVAYHNNIRYLKELTTLIPEDYSNRKLQFSLDGIYIITGGMGAIGLEIAKYLETKGIKNIALLNRSILPKRELWADIIKTKKYDKVTSIISSIISLEEKGVNIECVPVDIIDFASLKKVITDLRKRYGSIKAIIHSAGIAGDGFIKNKSKEEFRKVLEPKIEGMINIDILTQKDNLDFILLCSAGTSILGAPGQSDYTVANAYLDGYSSYLNWKGKNVISINWAAWKEIGMAVDYKSNQDGILKAISTKDAMVSLDVVLEKYITNVIIGEVNLENEIFENEILQIGLSDNIKNSIKQIRRSKIEKKSDSINVKLIGKEDDNYTKTERAVGMAFSEILGLSDINIYDDIYSLGGDSLTSMHILKKINKYVSIQLEVADFFEYPNVYKLSAYIDKINTEYRENNAICYEEVKLAPQMDYYPLTSSQERIYMAESVEQNLLMYNNLDIWKVIGELNISVLRNAVEMLVEKHEILRTGFSLQGGKLGQKIYAKGEYEFTVLENCDDLEKVIKEFERPFNLKYPQLIRFKVIKNCKGEQYILVDIHHIIYDGMSTQILIKDLTDFYQLKEMVLLPIQYKDFSVFQKKYYLSEQFNRQRKFWLDRFSEKIPVLDLSTDYIRPKRRSFNGDTVCHILDDNMLKQINQLASRTGTTTNIILLSVLNILLSKYTNQNDIVIGTPVNGRTRPYLDKMIGIFINIVLMRNDVNENKKFIDFLNDVKCNAFDAYNNQDYPFDRLVNELKIQRETNRNPLFDIMFNFLNIGEKKVRIPGLEFIQYKRHSYSSKYDLTLIASEKNNKLVLEFEYCTDLFKKETIFNMLNHYVNILISVLDNEKIILKNIDMISYKEKQCILNRFNQTKFKYAKEKSIHELIINQARLTPNSIALISGNQTMTYKELDDRSSKISYILIQKGVTSNKVVALMCNRNFDIIIGILGILKARGAYLPIDPTYPSERIQYMLEDSETELLLTNLLKFDKIQFRGEIIKLDTVDEKQLSYSIEKEYVIDGNQNDLAYIIYTSGSSGKPKGVMVEHGAVVNFIYGMIREIDFNISKKILNLTTISFDIFILEVIVPLSQGMQVVIASEEEQLNFEMLGETIKKHKINMLQVTPSRLQIMLENKYFVQCVDCIKILMVGGETLSSSLLIRLRKVFPNAYIYNMYGPTETTVWCSVKKLKDENEITIGKPILNTKMYIMSNHQLAPIGVKGELCIGGVGLARGYWNRNELTNEKFIENPFEQTEKLYRTGDIAKWLHNGEIQLFGRMDNQIKLRGFRIELGEIERKLLLIPEINEAVVIVKDKENELDKYLCAFIVVNSEITIKSLRNHLEKSLPAYMIPSVFINIDKLPSTANGKINRKELEDMHIDTEMKSTKESSLTEVEQYVLSVWSQVLGHSKINKNDNFFDIGGTSFNLLRMNNIMQEKYPGVVKIINLFENSTIEKMANYLEKVTSVHNSNEGILLMKLPEKFYSNTRKSNSKSNAFLTFTISTEELDKLTLLNKLKLSDFLFAIYSFVIMNTCKSNNVILYYGLDREHFQQINLDFSNMSDFEVLFKKVEILKNININSNSISAKNILKVIQKKTDKESLLIFGEHASVNNQVINYGDLSVEYLLDKNLVYINIHYDEFKYYYNEIENLKNMYCDTLHKVIYDYLKND